MLSREVQDRIVEFVRQKPRTVQEIAAFLEKNWRTADRYVRRIEEETGVLGVRTFRGGSRGALKVVFYAAVEPARGSGFESRLLQRVVSGVRKEDFSAFDVFQFANQRRAFLESSEFVHGREFSFDRVFEEAQEQVLIFSGNMSWLALSPGMDEFVLAAAARGVRVKVLSRVDVTSAEQLQSVRNVNLRCGRDAIEVRHCEQPVRGVVVDGARVVLKECVPALRKGEKGAGKFLFYVVSDESWVSFMQKVFWQLWGSAVDASVRSMALDEVNR